MPENKIALIGDIVASRTIKKRSDFDGRLAAVLQQLNRRGSGLLSPYTVTIGDEIQALFSQADHLLCDTVTIQAALYPRRMRFAIGVGQLVTPVNPLRAIGMDGPAFHRARDGIQAMKKTRELYIVQGDLPNLPLINAALALVSHEMYGWKATRLNVLERLMSGQPVRQIAAGLNVTEQAVYKSIHAGALEKVIELFRQIEGALNQAVGE